MDAQKAMKENDLENEGEATLVAGVPAVGEDRGPCGPLEGHVWLSMEDREGVSRGDVVIPGMDSCALGSVGVMPQGSGTWLFAEFLLIKPKSTPSQIFGSRP